MESLKKLDESTTLTYQLAWDLFVELRKEILADQKIRVTLMGAKITFVSAALAAIIANITENPNLSMALIVPAIIAIFFDFSINSMNFAIKRAGFYSREIIEPELAKHAKWPAEKPLWHRYLCHDGTRQIYSIIGNIGLTAIAVGIAAYPIACFFLLSNNLLLYVSIALFAIIVAFFIYDIRVHLKVRSSFPNEWKSFWKGKY